MLSKIKKNKNDRGVALIFTLLIVTVLFTLSSFLISKVLINTRMVEKISSEEENYSLAKAGILYAIDRLNNWSGESPDYDSTDWPGNTNWNEYDIDSTHSGNDVYIKVIKDSPSSGFITIESQDIDKEITLQAIAEYKSPLTEYVRIIGSDTTFGDNTFGDSGSGALIQGNAPFCILGNLTWQGTNNLILNTTTGNNTVVYGDISSTGTLTINVNSPDAGYYYYTSSDPTYFDTGNGHYFDKTHLPSCYDYSGDNPIFYYGNPKSIIWPRINETRYSNLVGGSGSDYYIPGNPTDESECWYTIPGSGWSKDSPIGSTSSYTYTGTGTLIILDGNGQTSGTAGQVGIDDGRGGETANDGIITGSEWRTYPLNGVIYSPGNLKICGVIGDDGSVSGTPHDYNLTIVSGGTIYIESNIFKGTDNSSLALLAKDYVTLNTTHRFMRGVDTNSFAFPGWSSPEEDILGEPDGDQLRYAQFFFGWGIAVMDLEHPVTSDEIDLNNVDFGSVTLIGADFMFVYASNNDSLSISSSDKLFGFLYDFDFLDLYESTHYDKIRCFQDTYAPSGVDPFNFTHIKIELIGFGLGPSWVRFDSVEVPLTHIENTLFFAEGEDKSWAVIPGNLSATENYAFTINGSIAEGAQEQTANWSSKWPKITYTYSSNLANNPPPYLPTSVNLISLRRD